MYLNLFLTAIGLVAAVHLICTASLLASDSPLSMVLEVSGGFAAAVGVVVTSVHADQARSLMFSGALALFLVLLSLERALRGRTTILRLDPSSWIIWGRRHADHEDRPGNLKNHT